MKFDHLQVSQTITRGGPRSQIAIPAQGMIEFRDALTDLLEEFGTNDGGYVQKKLSFDRQIAKINITFETNETETMANHNKTPIFRFKGELPEGRHMKVQNKNFYFDIGQNNRGIYMRISEVSVSCATPIIILPNQIKPNQFASTQI